MNIDLDLNKKIYNKNNINLKLENNNKFEKGIGKIINIAVDIGIKAALPDLIEDKVIEIKNILLKNGLKDGIKEISKKVKDTIDTIIGINKNIKITDIRNLTKRNGIINDFSKIINLAIDTSVKNKMISKELAGIIKSGKTAMLSNFSNRLEKNMMKEIKTIEKFKEAISKWEEALDKRDIEELKKQYQIISKNYNNMSSDLKDIIDIDKIEYINQYINKNKNIKIDNEEFELLKKIA